MCIQDVLPLEKSRRYMFLCMFQKPFITISKNGSNEGSLLFVCLKCVRKNICFVSGWYADFCKTKISIIHQTIKCTARCLHIDISPYSYIDTHIITLFDVFAYFVWEKQEKQVSLWLNRHTGSWLYKFGSGLIKSVHILWRRLYGRLENDKAMKTNLLSIRRHMQCYLELNRVI